MATDLFLSPPAAQSPFNKIQGDQTGSKSLDQTDNIRSSRESSDTQSGRFLKTLKKVSRDQTSNKCTNSARDERRIEKTIVRPDDKTDEASNDAVPSEDLDLRVRHDSDPVPQVLELDFTAFMNSLAVMEMNGGGEFGTPTALNPNTLDRNQMAAIDTGIAHLEQNPMGLTVDLRAGVERVPQAAAGVLSPKGTVPLDGKLDQVPASRISFEVTTGSSGSKEISGSKAGPAASSLKSAETLFTVNRTEIDTTAKSSANHVSESNSDVHRSGAAAFELRPMSIREDGELVRIADNARQTDNENRSPQSVPSLATLVSDTPKSQETLHLLHGPRIGGAENLTGSRMVKTDLPSELATGAHQDSRTSQLTATSHINSALTHVSEAQNHSTVREEPVSRIIQDMQPSRDGLNRVKIDLSDESTGKVIKSEAASNDNSLLNSSGQSAEKNAEAAAATKETNAGQGISHKQTLDQIVRKAAIHLRNGQQEVRIDLKPDFLGHMRMQVISENHLVTIKILAEHGFVKDMLENNLHHLKADLQQQGLEIDKVEVSVSQDLDDDSSSKDKPAQSKLKMRTTDQRDVNRTADEHKEESRQSKYASDSGAIVDHFA